MRAKRAVLALLTVCPLIVLAGGVQQKIQFKPGEYSTMIEGSVLRGDQDKYTLTAQAGQMMTVLIKSIEDNAVFQIYWDDEDYEATLTGADEATQWAGELPGEAVEHFNIIVAGTRGNATYTLEVAIE